jgi:hypothetical protein
MLGKFWEEVDLKLADRWAVISAPALVFWLGGLLAWAYSRGGWSRLAAATHWLSRQSAVAEVAVTLAALLAVAASGLVVQRLTFPVLRLIEGYWPAFLNGPRRSLVSRVSERATTERADLQKLADHVLGDIPDATAEQRASYVRLDRRRRLRPSRPDDYMPTRLGNILRAAETRPGDKYGLDAVVVWPRLWLLLPEAARQELLGARAGVDSAVAGAIWGVLFCVFAAWTPLAVLAGLVVAAASVGLWAPDRAEVFGDLVEASYDLYRVDLFRQLRWPLPTDPQQERLEGKKLTEYLLRGSDDPLPIFTPPS